MNILDKIDDTYVYGPLSASDVAEILVPHRLIKEDDGFYVGTAIPQDQWFSALIPRPVVEPLVIPEEISPAP